MFARNDYIDSLKKIASELYERAPDLVGEKINNLTDLDIYIHINPREVPNYSVDKSFVLITLEGE